MKKFLKIFLISLASLLLLVVIAGVVISWLIFTPEKLTPIVRKQAAKYILCPSEIGKVELTFFSTFPQFGLKADQLTLIHPVPGAPNDTVMDVKELIGIIDIKALIRNNELIVNEFRLTDGSICAYVNSIGHTNFDIFNITSEPDTTQTDMVFKVIDIESVELKNMNVLYVDESLNLKTDVRRLSAKINGSMKTGDIVGTIDAKPFDLSMQYYPDETSALETEINMSAKINSSVKSGVVNAAVAINNLDAMLHYNSDSLTFDTGILNLSAAINALVDGDHISGIIRMESDQMGFAFDNEKYLQNVPVGLNIDAEADLSRQFIRLKDASLTVNDLKLDLAGTVENDTVQKLIATDLSYKFASWPVKSVISLIPPSFASYVEGIEAGGLLSSEGTVNGVYSSSSMPLIDSRVLLEKGTLRYAGFPLPLNAIYTDMRIHTDLKDPQSFVRINRFDAKTPKSSVKTAGTITRLFSDMHIDLNSDADLILSEFAPLIPDSMKITANGAVSGKVKTDFLMSQLTNMELEKMKLSGTLTISDLDATYDSISVKTDQSTIEFALPNPRASTYRTQFLYADISANALDASKINSFKTSLQNAKISLETSDVRDSLSIPNILCSYNIAVLTAEMDSGLISVVRPAGNIAVAPRRNAPKQPEIKMAYNSSRIKADFGPYSAIIENLGLDVNVENDPEQKDVVMQWTPRGYIDLDKGTITMSSLLYPIEIPGIFIMFDPEMIHVERGYAKIDQSDFSLAGKLTNISSYIRGDSLLRGEFDFISGTTDIHQIMNITSGIGYDEAEKEAAAESGPYLVPKGMDILLHTDIGYASYGAATNASQIKGDLHVRDGMLVFNDIAFATPAGETRITAEYRTTRPNQRKNHLYLGLALHLYDIEIGELLRMIPSVDSIMPMLRSFGGQGEFHFAGDLYVDSMYNVKPSTIRAAASISGSDMVLMDSELFSDIAKSLRFNKQTENKVDSLSAEFTVLGEEIHVYPFLIVMDKYKVVISGRHYLDMTFDYNVSVVQSPLPFRLAVDIKGTPDDYKFKVGRSNFPDFYRPRSQKLVESREAALRKIIRDGLTGRSNN